MSVKVPLSEFSGCSLSDKVQGMANLLYKELEIIIDKFGSDSVKDLMTVLVSILETLDRNLKEKLQLEVDLELSQTEFEHVKKMFDKEKSLRKSMEAKYLETEDFIDEMKKQLNQLTNTSKISTKRFELRIKNLSEQVLRLEEKDQCNKEDYLNIHKKYSDLLKNHNDQVQHSSKTTLSDNPVMKSTEFNSKKTFSKPLDFFNIDDQIDNLTSIMDFHELKEPQCPLTSNLNSLHHDNLFQEFSSTLTTNSKQRIIKSDYDLTSSLSQLNNNTKVKICSSDCVSPDGRDNNSPKVIKLNQCKLIEENHIENPSFISEYENNEHIQENINIFELEKEKYFREFSASSYADNNQEINFKQLLNTNQINLKSSIIKNTQDHSSLYISQEDLSKNCNVDKLYGDCILASNQGQKYYQTIENAFCIEEDEESVVNQEKIIAKKIVCNEEKNDFNHIKIHKTADISLYEELSILDENNDISSVGSEVEKLIQENNELLVTKNALNVLKDDLISEVEDLSNEVELLKKEMNYLVLEKSEREIKINELEKEIKKIKNDLKKAQGELEEKDKDSFSRVELVKVLMERNQYKEKLMELQEAIRWAETIRAKKAHSEILSAASPQRKLNNYSVWGAFNSFLGFDKNLD